MFSLSLCDQVRFKSRKGVLFTSLPVYVEFGKISRSAGNSKFVNSSDWNRISSGGDWDATQMLKEDLAKHDLEYKDFLGVGNFSVVCEVECLRDRSRHALKYLKKTVQAGELMLWPVLDHPNVLPVEAIFTVVEATPMFLMPLADRTLSEALRDEAFRSSPDAFDRGRRWTKDVASGVAHMHRLGIAHMDLTASNVLVTSAGVARVADFTLVCSASNPTGSYGTQPHLAPPEACESFDLPLVDPLSFDAWSLGTLALKSVLLGRRIGRKPPEGWLGDEFRWFRDAYPRLKQDLQPAEFADNVAAAFPASDPSEEDVAAARNFVLSLLRLDPAARATPEQVLEHEYLGGRLALFPTDAAWLDTPPPRSEPIDEERHRREVEEIHARLAGQRPVEDGRLTEYQGRVPWIRLEGSRVGAFPGEEESPDRAPATEQAPALTEDRLEDAADRGADEDGRPGTDSDYSPTSVRALITDMDEFLARCRSAESPEVPGAAEAAPQTPQLTEDQTERPVRKGKHRRIRAWAARVRKLFGCCLGRNDSTDD